MPVGSASRCRQLIKAEELIAKAQDSVLLPNDKETNKALTPAEVGIIKLLLNKVIPDLKGVEHSGSIDSEITKRHKVEFFGTSDKTQDT